MSIQRDLWAQPMDEDEQDLPAPTAPARQVYTLRPYQELATERCVKFLNNGGRDHGVLVMPTGTGKSLVIAEIIKRMNHATLVLQPSVEILEQNRQKLLHYGYHCGVYSASAGRKDVSKITLATIGSIVKKPALFDHIQTIIIDECHRVNPDEGQYKQFITKFPNVRCIGLTATPYRLHSFTDSFGIRPTYERKSMLRFITRTQPKMFSTLIKVIQNKDMFEQGFLCPLEYVLDNVIDRGRLKSNTTGSDYDNESVRKEFERTDMKSKLQERVEMELSIGCKHVLVFTQFVHEALALRDRMPDVVSVVTADTKPAEREYLTRNFLNGKIPVMANVGVYTTGFDFPALDSIVIARPTKSLPLWCQMIGRGVRTFPGKTGCRVTDMCGTHGMFGPIENIRIGPEPNGLPAVFNNQRQLTNIAY